MIKSGESPVCQCHCVPQLSSGIIHDQQGSILLSMKLFLKRNISDANKRKLKKLSGKILHNVGAANKINSSHYLQTDGESQHLSAGDIIRVRSEEEIQATLDEWNELKSCKFMDEQKKYCNTIQRVLKPVERFVDERDYRIKKAKGLVLLEGVICEGTPDYGRCDRACFYFWRVEWLEKLEQQ